MASGDPAATGVVLWTRLSGASGAATEVRWQVATDAGLGAVVASGRALATPESDFTVHVDVDGLEPGTTYWYTFEAADPSGPNPSGHSVRSPTGRTRTAPAGPVERLRIGVVCCANWRTGFFNAYGRLAERDVDVVLHLGDYIYESAVRKDRGPRQDDPPGQVTSLAQYRARYAQYRTDPDLQRLHQRHPLVAVWDDHELAGNAWWEGAGGHDPVIDGPWERRRTAAAQAYREWLPLRLPDPGDPLRLWRHVSFGSALDLVVLDTRLVGRERPASRRRPVLGIRRRDRSLLGDIQRRWLAETLRDPGHGHWTMLLSQVVVAPIHLVAVPDRLSGLGRRLGAVGGGLVVNSGQWDGYPDEREHLLGALAERRGEVLVVSGDLHSSWAAELEPEAGAKGADGPVAAEMVTAAVSARSFADALAPKVPDGQRLLEWAIRRNNRHVRFVDTAGHGYLLLDVTEERIEAEWWHVDTLDRRDPGEHLAARWSVAHGDPKLRPG